jgi:hypothetical protein
MFCTAGEGGKVERVKRNGSIEEEKIRRGGEVEEERMKK